ncbi:MAG: hypothetical protein ACLFVW_04605, partial [Phycisphaerae bacterium]
MEITKAARFTKPTKLQDIRGAGACFRKWFHNRLVGPRDPFEAGHFSFEISSRQFLVTLVNLVILVMKRQPLSRPSR